MIHSYTRIGNEWTVSMLPSQSFNTVTKTHPQYNLSIFFTKRPRSLYPNSILVWLSSRWITLYWTSMNLLTGCLSSPPTLHSYLSKISFQLYSEYPANAIAFAGYSEDKTKETIRHLENPTREHCSKLKDVMKTVWMIADWQLRPDAAQTTVPCVQAQGRTYDRPNVQPLQHRGRHNKTRPTLSRAANTRGHTSDTYTEASLRAPFGYGRFLQGSLSHLETQIIHRSRGSMGQPRRLMRASRSRIATPWVEVCVKVHSSLCYVKKHIIFIHSHSRLYRYFRLVRLANLNQARINILNG